MNLSTESASALMINKYSYKEADNIKDGTILDALSWSFNTIRSKLREIADCGYTSVQVSPIADCEECGNSKDECKWKNAYKPKEFKIGNYIVGTRDEFKALCDEAHKYNINIIVDVAVNSLSKDSSLNQPYFLHNDTRTRYYEYNKRYCLTQCGYLDAKTQNPAFQRIIKDFLNDCIDCGADGFRFDKADHIELTEEEDGDFGGDFWPEIIESIKSKKSDAFIYGDVLEDDMYFYKKYSKYMNLTADNYGKAIRKAIKGHNLMEIFDYLSGEVSPDKLVTYCETHDTYENNGKYSADMNE